MNTDTKIDAKIVARVDAFFEAEKKKYIEIFSQMDSQTKSYDFEKEMQDYVHSFGREVYQLSLSPTEKHIPKNDKMELLTSFGEVTLRKSHPLAVAPSGYKISPYLQEEMCRIGSKMPFTEAEEELQTLLSIPCNAKQIERLCHHYGQRLEEVDWAECYKEGHQLNIPFQNHINGNQLYVMMDGSMILTRALDPKWREFKLCRMFYASDRIKGISHKRNFIARSNYVGHLGDHEEFLDKVLDSLPKNCNPVFIADGAKWIWNWVDAYFPKATQILDYYHCKEHICQFAKENFGEEIEKNKWIDECMKLLENEKVDTCLENLKNLKCKNKHLENEKDKLLKYLTNNSKRINYGYFRKKGLLVGSGAMESANRVVIQQRMKLSGQRWTLDGAKQMVNLRTCHKSGYQKRIKYLIDNHEIAA